MAEEQPELFEKDPEKTKVIKYASLKKKNKRVIVYFIKGADGVFSVQILTRRLIGDWKDRNIMHSHVGYGIESFEAIFSVFGILTEDFEYKKLTNPLRGQLEKDKYSAVTNIKF